MLGIVLFAVYLALEFVIDLSLGRATVEPFLSLLGGVLLLYKWCNKVYLNESDGSAIMEVFAVVFILFFYVFEYFFELWIEKYN